jgi:hypothetical protein
VKFPCSRCRNALCEDKRTWIHHGEAIHQRTTSVVEDEDDRSGDDRMDEMLEAIQLELETNREDPPTPKVQIFF